MIELKTYEFASVLPLWECFWDNEPSVVMAGKLGLIALPDYPVYFWEE